MTWLVAGKEWTTLRRDLRFRLAGAVVLVLLLAALVGGHQEAQREAREIAATEVAARKDWVEQGTKNPHAAAHYGSVLVKPRSPLGYLVPGVRPYLGVAVRIEAHKRNALDHRPAQDQSGLRRFGALAPASLIELLAPLVVILLGFSAVAGEREAGTLRQVLATGVAPRSLLAGKLAGLAIAMGALALVPALAAALTWAPGAAGDMPSAGLRTLGVAAVWGAFLLGWGAWTLAASCWVPRASEALVGLLALWGTTSLVVPRLGAELARGWHPTPSAVHVQAEILDGTRANRKERKKALLAETLAKHGVEEKRDLPVNFDGLWLQAMEDHDNALFDRFTDEVRATYEKQDGTRDALAWLSPMVAARTLTQALAGTDRRHHEHFSDSAEAFRRDLVRRMNMDMATNSRTGEWDYKASEELWASVDPFAYRFPDLSTSLAGRGLAALALAAWLLSGLAVLAVHPNLGGRR